MKLVFVYGVMFGVLGTWSFVPPALPTAGVFCFAVAAICFVVGGVSWYLEWKWDKEQRDEDQRS